MFGAVSATYRPAKRASFHAKRGKNMTVLKCCPFCGGEVEERGGTCNFGKKIMTLDVKCKKCETTFKFKHKWVLNPYVETVEAWNRRFNDGTNS